MWPLRHTPRPARPIPRWDPNRPRVAALPSASGRLGRSGAPRPLGAPLCGPSTTRQPLPVLRRGAMGGTTRASAWWAPNAPDLEASTSGRSGAPRPLGAPLCGPSARPGGRSARPSRDPAARPKGRMRRAPLNWAGWRPSRCAGPFHSAPPRWVGGLSGRLVRRRDASRRHAVAPCDARGRAALANQPQASVPATHRAAGGPTPPAARSSRSAVPR